MINLFLITFITFDVIGCPIGYGPEINNFTCNPCGNQYYNLSPDNVENVNHAI